MKIGDNIVYEVVYTNQNRLVKNSLVFKVALKISDISLPLANAILSSDKSPFRFQPKKKNKKSPFRFLINQLLCTK